MDEDDWLEGPTEGQGAHTDPLVDQEWTRLSTKYSDAGYREGITDGKLSTLQKGFDEGYALSTPLAFQIGALRGRITALLQYITPTSGDSALAEVVRGLMADLSAVRRDDILPVDTERIEHEKEDEQAITNGARGSEFELDQNDRRDLESLETAFDTLGGIPRAREDKLAGMKGEELLRWLTVRVDELEERAYGA